MRNLSAGTWLSPGCPCSPSALSRTHLDALPLEHVHHRTRVDAEVFADASKGPARAVQAGGTPDILRMEAPLEGFEPGFDSDVAHRLAVNAECGSDDLDGNARTVLICNLLALCLVKAHLGLPEGGDCAIIEHRID